MIKFSRMTLVQLQAYRASVEAYGTSRELYDVEKRIAEKGEKQDEKQAVIRTYNEDKND